MEDYTKDIERFLAKLRIRKMRAAKQALEKAAILVQNDAKILCPKDTGRLMSSIRYRVLEDGQSAEVGSNVEYAGVLEYGGKRIKVGTPEHPIQPKHPTTINTYMPYLRASLYRNQLNIRDIFREELGKV
jgi:phage gpG-like protein